MSRRFEFAALLQLIAIYELGYFYWYSFKMGVTGVWFYFDPIIGLDLAVGDRLDGAASPYGYFIYGCTVALATSLLGILAIKHRWPMWAYSVLAAMNGLPALAFIGLSFVTGGGHALPGPIYMVMPIVWLAIVIVSGIPIWLTINDLRAGRLPQRLKPIMESSSVGPAEAGPLRMNLLNTVDTGQTVRFPSTNQPFNNSQSAALRRYNPIEQAVSLSGTALEEP